MTSMDSATSGSGDDVSREKRLTARVAALQSLLAASSAALQRPRLRRVLVELLADGEPAGVRDEVRLLAAAADQFGLRTGSARLSISEALSLVRQGGRLATPLGGGGDQWVVLSGAADARICWTDAEREELLAEEEVIGRLVSHETTSWQKASAGRGRETGGLWWLAPVHQMQGGGETDEAGVAHHGEEGHGSPLRRLVGLLRPEISDIAIVTLFSAVVGILGLATPLAVESLVNTISFGRLLQPLFVLCLVLLVFLGFAAALRALQTYVAEMIQRRLFVRIVADLSYRLPRVNQRALDDQHTPELLNRFFDVMTVQKSAALLVLDGIAIVLQTLIGMALLAFYHPLLLGFDLLLLFTLACAIFLLGRGAVRTSIEESLAKYAVAAWLEELAHCATTFRGDGGARHACERADALTAHYIAARRAHFRILMRQFVFSLGMQAVCGSVLLAIGGWLVLRGQISLGQLVAAELIVAVIVGSFAKLGKHMESFYDLLAAVDKIGHLLDLPVERQSGDAVPRGSKGVALALHDVGYEFESTGPVFSHASCTIPSGDLVALLGPPGSGKSVMLDLMYALRHATHGHITVDGADIRTLHPASFRHQAALIRHVEVFSGTIAENVHLHRDDVGSQQVRESLEAVGLWEEILASPAGVETALQPSGSPLTNSQLRRLVLARALAGQPRLLLIDGLLDSLPDEVLPRIMQLLGRVRSQTTIVVVTGRSDISRHCRPWYLAGPVRPASAVRVAAEAYGAA